MTDWARYLRDMWHSDGRGLLIEDGALLLALLAMGCLTVWFVLRCLRPKPRGFEPVARNKLPPRA